MTGGSLAQASDVLAEQMQRAGNAEARVAGKGLGMPPLRELFNQGQLVRCTVLSMDEGERNFGLHLVLRV